MSNKTSDKNVGNKIKQQTENTIKYYKNIDNIEEVPIDILRAMYKDILSDYTRQKQINEEHRKLNGKLREKVKELEEKNKHLSNASDYETISLECTNLEEQLEIANDRIKELEEELAEFNKQLDLDYVDENYIPKQVVIDKIKENSNIEKEIEEKIKEEENSGDICREYIRDLKRQKGLVKRDILTLQELLEGEK